MKTKSWVLLLFLFFFYGCDGSQNQRSYKEVNIEPETLATQNMADQQDWQGKMPEDDFHRNLPSTPTMNLDINQMPDDDIHKAFRLRNSNAFSQQEMPNDDVHAQFRSNSMVSSPELINSVVPASLAWDVPEGWRQEPGGGMRIASFKSTEGPSTTETTIISLAGQAGGMTANVSRWMGQINMTVPPEQELEQFIAQQEKWKTASGLVAVVIDFTQLQKELSLETPSMIAVVIEGDSNRIFVKMTGSKEAVFNQKEAFKRLVQSLRNST